MDLAGEIWNGFAVFVYLWGQYPIGYGQLTMEHQLFLNFLFFVSLCSVIYLQAMYQLSGPVCKSTWRYSASYSASHLHFTLCD